MRSAALRPPALAWRTTAMALLLLAAAAPAPSSLCGVAFSTGAAAARGSSALVPAATSEPDVARRCAADLLALFGGRAAAAAVERARAAELWGCVRLLAPSASLLSRCGPAAVRHSSRNIVCDVAAADLEERIASPPAAVAELARRTVEWGGAPDVVLDALDPANFTVPDVEGSAAERCTLTKYDVGRRFAKKDLTNYMGFLFEAIEKLAPSVGLNISINRFDLFHGHMFTAFGTGRLGILFHSKEYPAYDEKKFPFNLGFCQKGSTLPYDDSMAFRNVVWLAPMPDCSVVLNTSRHACSNEWLAPGSLFVLDTGGGKILDRELVPDFLDVVHTVSEDDLGEVMLDVNYFNLANGTIGNRVFLC